MPADRTAHHERDEAVRRQRLLEAQDRAVALFEAVEDRGIIRPGAWDCEASDAIRDLAAELFGVEKHWHKRIVRSGPNTMLAYPENPPDRQMTDDDIAFGDFGPIFDGWEADFGRTWVLGDDPVKLRLFVRHLGSGDETYISSCPVAANGSIFEYWPEPVVELLIRDITQVSDDGALLCD